MWPFRQRTQPEVAAPRSQVLFQSEASGGWVDLSDALQPTGLPWDSDDDPPDPYGDERWWREHPYSVTVSGWFRTRHWFRDERTAKRIGWLFERVPGLKCEYAYLGRELRGEEDGS